MSSTFKAVAVTIFFSLLGIWYAPGAFSLGNAGIAIIISYVFLMAHTFLSIRCFSRIVVAPFHARLQALIDAVLVLTYIAVALNFSSPAWFSYFSLLLFIIAIVKYIHLWLVIKHSVFKELLLRKMVGADALGMGISLLVFLGVTSGHASTSLTLGAVVFAVASVYYFFIKPLYPII